MKDVGTSTKQYYSGFTIVELLIVVVVIAILAAITIVGYSGIQSQAQASVAASDLKQNTKTIMNAAVRPSTYVPMEIMPLGLSEVKVDRSKYKVATYCATVNDFVLLFETQSGRKFYQKNGAKMIEDSSIDSFHPCATAGVSSAWTTYLNLPTPCAAENGTCTFTGPATVVYGSAVRGNFSKLTNQSSPITCGNAAFAGDPASGFVKSCYVYPN